ncbi:hypothetical protein [Halovivax limisalsi]|uniref:hypothetical protein n=1 Tax=Halovivax limisalsi TaxID=1453760 RepID=UPI001FFD5929|nr:hypothetical protein [Halovivax limisalsi]
MADAASDGTGRSPVGTVSRAVQELRRRNANALAIDAFYLFTTGFLTILAMEGFWPAVIAAGPLVAFLLFALRSSLPFFVTNLLAIALAVVATRAGYVPF